MPWLYAGVTAVFAVLWQLLVSEDPPLASALAAAATAEKAGGVLKGMFRPGPQHAPKPAAASKPARGGGIAWGMFRVPAVYRPLLLHLAENTSMYAIMQVRARVAVGCSARRRAWSLTAIAARADVAADLHNDLWRRTRGSALPRLNTHSLPPHYGRRGAACSPRRLPGPAAGVQLTRGAADCRARGRGRAWTSAARRAWWRRLTAARAATTGLLHRRGVPALAIQRRMSGAAATVEAARQVRAPKWGSAARRCT